jgi:hypothetical protein
MLVYQLLKEQMSSEMQNILTAYQTNMKAGQYNAQFNGQNVDGQYVLNYYQSMLAGFPAGSTEYETLRSQLSAFEQQYKTDVQNLVIDSMNNGTKVDFGLLGSGFPNRGIDEVTLSDVREWSASTIAELTANGDITQADKLQGAVFVAGFNVDNDGKETALNNKDISYSAYGKWLGGQLQAALDAGFTKDSEAYRNILKIQSQINKVAADEDEKRAGEDYEKAIMSAMADVDAASKAILLAYDGPFKDEMGQMWNQVDGNSSSPYYDLIKKLASLKGQTSGGQLYSDLMKSVGSGNLDELFADAVVETNAKVTALIDAGFANSGKTMSNSLVVLANRIRSEGLTFLSDSGIEFTSGNASAIMSQMKDNLGTSGTSFSVDENGITTVRGGHPDAVISSLKGLGALVGDRGTDTYPWINDLSKGQIRTSYLGDSGLVQADTNGDDVITADEFGVFFSSGEMNNTELEAELGIMMNAMSTEDIPGSTIHPATLAYAFVEAAYNREALKHGSIMIVDDRGHTKVSEWGDKQAGDRELLPAKITVNGVDSIVYVKPVTIKQNNQGNYDDMDLGMTNGYQVQLYRLPGNYSNMPGQQADGFVIITGNMKDGSSGSAPMSIKLTIDQFESYARSAFGAEFDFTNFNNPPKDGTSDPFVSFTGSMAASSEIWENMANPTSQYYVKNLPLNADQPNGLKAVPGFDEKELTFTGLLNLNTDVDKWVAGLVKDPGALSSAALEIARSRRGADAQFDTKDLIDAALQSNGIADNLAYVTVAGKIQANPVWKTFIDSKFPEVKRVSVGASAQNAEGAQKWRNMIPGFQIPDMTTGYVKPGVKSEEDKKNEDRYRNMIPGFMPKKTDGEKSGFLSTAFRNKPEMAAPTTPKIKTDGIMPSYTTPKFSTGTQPKIKPNSPFKQGQGV